VHAFSDLATAAYCPRKLYYRLRDGDHETPDLVEKRRALAFRYPALLSSDADLASEPIAVTPTQFRANLGASRERVDAFPALADPPATNVYLDGREARGIAHKVLEAPLAPSIVSAGEPPEEGAWRPQTARVVAAAKALAWERETTVEAAFVEYPAYGVVRRLPLSTRRKAIYREAVERAASIDGPPARLNDESRCDPCEYRETCGVTTRSLRSLLQP
jgi:CRISPR-associated exonuclease Cas4